MKKILIIAGFSHSLLLFRGELMKSWLERGYAVTAAAPGTDLKAELRCLGVEYRDIPLYRTTINPWYDIILIYNLIYLIKREKPSYLFLYTIKPVIYGSIAAYFDRKCKVFSMITGLGYVFINGARGKRKILQLIVEMLYRMALYRNNNVFFQNMDDMNQFESKKIVKLAKAIKVNGSGVNLDYFKQTDVSSRPIRFLMIARLLKEKGLVEYVEAARMVKEKYPEVHFKLVGWTFDDNPSAISQQLIEAWKEEGVVEIHGETSDVRPFIASASVYVLPSYREGTPRTVLEAMAMGRAVITTDAPGCRETVVEGENGFLVPVKDSVALAEAMVRFIQKPELITIMGAASRKIAEKKFNVHKVNRVINKTMGLL